jgi:hypothetical protein
MVSHLSWYNGEIHAVSFHDFMALKIYINVAMCNCKEITKSLLSKIKKWILKDIK